VLLKVSVSLVFQGCLSDFMDDLQVD